MTPDPDSWPELIYRFVEHYRWEPQHLGPDRTGFYRKIRTQEVPLNLLFNMLLHVLPSAVLREWLGSVLPLRSSGTALRVRMPCDAPFGQPDVQIESEGERIFIELKVTAHTGLEQAQKYVLLHARCRNQDLPTPKQPSLLYVTRDGLTAHWTPTRQRPVDARALLLLLQAAPLTAQLATSHAALDLREQYHLVLDSLQLGACRWQELADSLAAIRQNLPDSTQCFVAGFLHDLTRRGLWKPSDTARFGAAPETT